MQKNKAGQSISFQMVTTAGAAVTSGTPVVYVTKDSGTQATGTGTSAHEGNGEWSYAPEVEETNADHLAFTMTLATAINQTGNVYTKSSIVASTIPQVPAPPLENILHLWLDASKGVTLTGGEVSTWADQSDNANDCTQTVAASRPTPVVDVAGRQGIAFGNSDTEITFMDIPVGVSTNHGNISVFAVAHFYGDVGQPNSIITFDSINDNNGTLGSFSPTSVDPAFLFTSNSSGTAQTSALKDQNNIAVMGYSSDATSIRFYDQTNTDSTTAMTGTATGGKIGSWNLIRGLRGTIYEILVYDRALTAAESLSVVAYLKKRYGILDITHSIVFEGDSITQGLRSDHNRNYLFYMNLPEFRVHNAGFVGDKLADVITDGAALDTNRKIAGLTNTIMAMVGINDIISSGRSAGPMAADAETWAAARVAAGWDNVGVVTIMPGNGTDANEAVRIAYNDLLRDVAGNSWTFVIDLDDDPEMNAYPNNLATTYWAVDGNHPNSEGYRRVGKSMSKKLSDFLNVGVDNAIVEKHVADRGVYMTIDDRQGRVWGGSAMVQSDPSKWVGIAIPMTESPPDGGQYTARMPSLLPSGLYKITTYDRDKDAMPNPGDQSLQSMWYRWDGTTIHPMDTNVYFADLRLVKDDSGSNDRYTAQWFKDDAAVSPTTSPIPTIQVVKASDGTDLVASTNMTLIGSTGAYRYDEPTNRITAGQSYIMLVTATVDGVSQTWRETIGRDST